MKQTNEKEEDSQAPVYVSPFPGWVQWTALIMLIGVLLLVAVAIIRFILFPSNSMEADKRLDRLEQGYDDISVQLDSMLHLIGRNQAAIEHLEKKK